MAGVGLRFSTIDFANDPRYKVLGSAPRPDTSFGNTVPVEDVINSLLLDGSLVVHRSDGNREALFYVQCLGDNLDEVAAAGEAIAVELYKTTTLVWTPPDGIGEVCVFDVQTSQQDFDFDEYSEIVNKHTYALRIVCLPYVRPAVPDVVVATPVAAGTPTLIDAGTATTNWVATSPATLSVVASGSTAYGNCLRATVAKTLGSWNATYYGPVNGYMVRDSAVVTKTLTPAVDFSGTPYVYIDSPPVLFQIAGVGTFQSVNFTTATVDGVPLVQASFGVSPLDPAWTRTTFITQDSSATHVQFTMGGEVQGVPVDPNLHTGSVLFGYDNIWRTSVPPSGGTTKSDGMRSFALRGSMRTPVSVQIDTGGGTNNLQDVGFYTYGTTVAAYSPTLRPWQIGTPTVTTDTGAMSGGTVVLNSAQFAIPMTQLPRGSYDLLMRLKSSSGTVTGPITWTVQTVPGTSPVGAGTGQTFTGTSDTLSITTNWNLFSLGSLILAPTDIPIGSGGYVLIRFSTPAGSGSSIILDQGWTFWAEGDSADPTAPKDSDITVVRGCLRYLWIDSPDLSNRGIPQIWTGNQPDRSDAYHAGALSEPFAIHQMRPPNPQFYVMSMPHDASSTFPTPVTVTGTLYPRFLHHVVKKAA